MAGGGARALFKAPSHGSFRFLVRRLAVGIANSPFRFSSSVPVTVALVAGLISGSLMVSNCQGQTVVASSPVVGVATTGITTSRSYVCPKCGRVHSTPGVAQTAYSSVATSGAVIQAGTAIQNHSISSVNRSSAIGSTAQNVLSVLNGQRSRQGLRPLRYDASLQAVAERRARQMAASGMKSHPPGSFAPGRYEGVGWSSSYSPNGVHACYTSNPNMTSAGAAMVAGRDGVYFAVVYR